MRRVVAEQIKALGDLNEVVQRSSRNLDIAEASAPAPTRIEPPRMEPPRMEAPRMEAPRMEAPRIEAPRVEAPRMDPMRIMEATRTMEKAPLPPADFAIPSAPAMQDDSARSRRQGAPGWSASPERGPGWLSDLLARASKDEAEPAQGALSVPAGLKAQQRGGASLDSIADGISRMVDNGALVEAWDRFYRNERNAFSRRIYIGQGQQTFDEIRRRYAGDADFRATVDRYTQEFERVLTDVARDDRDGTLGRAYLISNQGKVYTMLAHASGRIE